MDKNPPQKTPQKLENGAWESLDFDWAARREGGGGGPRQWQGG